MTVSRRKHQLEGRLQGVGFRPLVYRLARGLALTGWVRNSTFGVEMEVQGKTLSLDEFERKLREGLPSPALIRNHKIKTISCIAESEFKILESTEETDEGATVAEALPDLGICLECEREIGDPENRRYRYPFTHCTQCGPRYSISLGAPFDRARTTMAEFPLCLACQAEYRDPEDRRFHAQTISCPECGPTLRYLDRKGESQYTGEDAIIETARKIREGAVVAVLGVGGFHLFCDAKNTQAIEKLRAGKKRESKPFALIAPDLESIEEVCHVNSYELQALTSPGAPIVILEKKEKSDLDPISGGLGTLGVMLPYTPLHSLLLRELGFRVVATSGNVADEPLYTSAEEALLKLRGIADGFLVHNRKIQNRIDDSLVRIISGTEVVLRAGRGYAPQVFTHELLSSPSPFFLGFSGQMKTALAYGKKNQVVLLPHLGNLGSLESDRVYEESIEKSIENLRKMQGESEIVFCSDLHSDYHSTQVAENFAKRSSSRLFKIQHHEAHLYSAMLEHSLTGEFLGVSWDGTGYGRDGTIWGGEFFRAEKGRFQRVFNFRKFPLPGGEAAVREPRRSALGILYSIMGVECLKYSSVLGFEEQESGILLQMMEKKLNAPQTSSAGRLFDAVSALLGLRMISTYDGQAAMELEMCASLLEKNTRSDLYPIRIEGREVDWEPWILGILAERENGVENEEIAVKFHRTLAQAIVEISKKTGNTKVLLSGGCFQNRILAEEAIQRLRDAEVTPYWNQKIPPNDGGLAAGQVFGGQNVLIHSS